MRSASTFVAHDGYVTDLQFAPQGELLYSAGMDNVVQAWATEDWRCVATFEGHEKSVNSLAVTPDGKTLVTGSSDNWVRIWDAATQATRHNLRDRKRVVASVAFSPEEGWIAAGSYKGRVAVWDLEGKSIVGFAASPRNVTTVSFSPKDPTLLVTGGLGATIRAWTLPGATQEHELELATAAIARAAFTPDGSRLVALTYEGRLHAWDVSTWQEMTLASADFGKEARIFRLDRQGRRCVVLHKGRAELRSYPELRVLEAFGVDANVLSSAAFHPEGHRLAIGGADGKIRVWDLR